MSEYSGRKIYFSYSDEEEGEIEVAERIRCPQGFKSFVEKIVAPNVIRRIKEGKFKVKDGGGYCLLNKILE